jgi:hypothetical protein
VLMGDSALAADRYGAALAAGDAMSVGVGEWPVHLANMYARSSGAGQKLNVTVVR